MIERKLVIVGVAALCLTGCGSEVEEPVEQIVVAEPGEEADYASPDEPDQADPTDQPAE